MGRPVELVLRSRVVGTVLTEGREVEARFFRGVVLLPLGALLTWALPPYFEALGVLLLCVAVWLIYSDPPDGRVNLKVMSVRRTTRRLRPASSCTGFS